MAEPANLAPLLLGSQRALDVMTDPTREPNKYDMACVLEELKAQRAARAEAEQRLARLFHRRNGYTRCRICGEVGTVETHLKSCLLARLAAEGEGEK